MVDSVVHKFENESSFRDSHSQPTHECCCFMNSVIIVISVHSCILLKNSKVYSSKSPFKCAVSL